jgi:hypothetical protein
MRDGGSSVGTQSESFGADRSTAALVSVLSLSDSENDFPEKLLAAELHHPEQVVEVHVFTLRQGSVLAGARSAPWRHCTAV